MRLASGLERPVVSNPSRRIRSRSSRVKVSTWPARSPCCAWPLVCARSPCCARSVTRQSPTFSGLAFVVLLDPLPLDLPGHPEVPAAQSGPAVARGGCQRSRRPARQESNQSGGFARGELQEDGSEWLGYAWVLWGYVFVVSPCRVSASGALGGVCEGSNLHCAESFHVETGKASKSSSPAWPALPAASVPAVGCSPG